MMAIAPPTTERSRRSPVSRVLSVICDACGRPCRRAASGHHGSSVFRSFGIGIRSHFLPLAHVLVGEPVSTPDQVRGRLSPEHALVRPADRRVMAVLAGIVPGDAVMLV